MLRQRCGQKRCKTTQQIQEERKTGTEEERNKAKKQKYKGNHKEKG